MSRVISFPMLGSVARRFKRGCGTPRVTSYGKPSPIRQAVIQNSKMGSSDVRRSSCKLRERVCRSWDKPQKHRRVSQMGDVGVTTVQIAGGS